MKKILFLVVFFLIFSLVSCEDQTSSASMMKIAFVDTIHTDMLQQPEPIGAPDNRTAIRNRLKNKKMSGNPLVVHIYIPLCDNDNQGIVPTTKSLGDGMSLRTNLYWATSSATKGFFSKHPDWKLLFEQQDIDTNVLERIVYRRKYKEANVYLVADAYRGDRMQETVNDFLAALSNNRNDSVLIDNQYLQVGGASDLIVFNGHNGMMDPIIVKNWVNTTNKQTDAVINACVSYNYFSEELNKAGAYPLARTTSLLHPGAYVLTQIIDDWVRDVDEKQLCLNAGQAYCNKHSCGKGTKIYKSGW